MSSVVPRAPEGLLRSLFVGTLKYALDHLGAMIVMGFHLSVSLFFYGLVIFFFTVETILVATVVSVSLGVVFGNLYMGLIVPDLSNLSYVWWSNQQGVRMPS